MQAGSADNAPSPRHMFLEMKPRPRAVRTPPFLPSEGYYRARHKDDKTDTKTHEMTGKCPFGGDRIGGSLGAPPTLSDWYPDRLKVELLHQNRPRANPLADHFYYATAFNTI